MKSKLCLSFLRLKNFRAVQDSRIIDFTLFAAFIGNNGSHKSSIIVSMFWGALG